MAKINLIPGGQLPTDTSLDVRFTRNGFILSNDGKAQKRKRKAPEVASELNKAPDCLKEARTIWANFAPEVRIQLAAGLPIMSEVRFPSPGASLSIFNRFLGVFSAYYFGNYYNNGILTLDSGVDLVPLDEQCFQIVPGNGLTYPSFSLSWLYGNPSMQSYNFDNIRLSLSDKILEFWLSFTWYPWVNPPFSHFYFNFSSDRQFCGFLFYISTPSVLPGAPFDDPGRLLIATYRPSTFSYSAAGFSAPVQYRFFGPLAKYVELSNLDLKVGDYVKITCFAVSLYGQSTKLKEVITQII